MSLTTNVRYVSERQIAFIASLREQKGLAPLAYSSTATTRQASAEIERLLALSTPERPAREDCVTETGMYRRDGVIYKVQKSQQSRRLYAKVLTVTLEGKGKFVFRSGAIIALTPADRMTLEQAKEFGVETGVCCVCGAELTNPTSVAAGIGPVCSGRI